MWFDILVVAVVVLAFIVYEQWTMLQGLTSAMAALESRVDTIEKPIKEQRSAEWQRNFAALVDSYTTSPSSDSPRV